MTTYGMQRSHVFFLQQYRHLSSDAAADAAAAAKVNRSRVRRRTRDGGIFQSNDKSKSSNNGGGGDDDDATLSRTDIKMVKDKEQFLKISSAYLTKVMNALEPMKSCNDVFNLERSSNIQGEVLTIGLKPSEGKYILQIDEDSLTATLNSPMSGNYTYVLCNKTFGFIGIEDNHVLEGMLVRDLIRHCIGLPKF